tara:strand:+ start:1413 stop:1712 length:300 start_codon:yes stop_codon:yes gene_type:complete
MNNEQIPLPFEEPMDDYRAVGIAEGFLSSNSQGEYLRAWQYLIDTGLAWSLQGFFGRTNAPYRRRPLYTTKTITDKKMSLTNSINMLYYKSNQPTKESK